MAETSSSSTNRPAGFQAVVDHIKQDSINFVLWVSRLLTIVFALGFLLPIIWPSNNAYNKLMLASAVTSALRLYVRIDISTLSFSKETLHRILSEDACHYLMYSMIFRYVTPAFILVIPVVLFAILHFASYSIVLLDKFGQNSCWPARLAISLVEFQSSNMLRMIAFVEIFIAPFCFFMLITGRASLFTPLIYAQFLMMRYSSHRNPHTRNMFYRLRLVVETFANKPQVPKVIGNILFKGIELVSRLAPPVEMQQQQQQQHQHQR